MFQFVKNIILSDQNFRTFNTAIKSNPINNSNNGPTPIVIAGPSGVGKGTIINKFMTQYPHLFGFSVSHTTRAPRPGEVDGVHYNFVTKAEFENAVARGAFVEHAEVHTNYYGTSFQAIENVRFCLVVLNFSMFFNNGFFFFFFQIRQQNKICILDIDIQGVQKVKQASLPCKYLFIRPPSMEALESRLIHRNTETMEKIQIRISNAKKEIEYSYIPGNFDEIIVNDKLEMAYEEIVQLFKSWFPQLLFTPVTPIPSSSIPMTAAVEATTSTAATIATKTIETFGTLSETLGTFFI
jgi:guanylate kinase